MKNLILTLITVFVALFSYGQDDKALNGKELFGSLEARHIGPALMSGRITDIEIHPSNSRIIYVGTAGGGVWKSNNGGATFIPIFDKHIQSIGVVKVDPKDPDQVIWVGTGETWTRNSVSVGDGLYKSIDGGKNWDKVGFEKSERISSIAINPENTDEMYVGVLGSLWGESEDRGVYKSVDGGKTWEKILYVNAGTGCSELIMDSSNPSVLYASFWEFRRTAWSFSSGGDYSALYKSVDGGKTWQKIHNGFPSGKLGRIAVAIAPSEPQRLYAVLETEKEENNGLWRSDNAGASWQHLNRDFELVVRPFYFSKIVVDPKNPDIVAKAGLSGSLSRDGGKTFKGMGNMHSDIHDVAFDINNSNALYVGTDGGVYRTWDNTNTMEMAQNIPVSQFYHVSVDNAEPYNVYGGLQDNGSWWGPSSSRGGIEARDWHRVGQGDGFRVLKHHTRNYIYTEMQGAENVWRIDLDNNRIRTVQPLSEKGDPKLRFNWNAPIALSEKNPDRIYIGSQFLHKSDDMGETWLKISPDLTTNDPAKQTQENSGGLSRDNSGAENHCTIFTVAESPLSEEVIWVGTDDGQVQITQDAGKSWQNVTVNIPGLPKNTWCYHIEASVFDKAKAYAVFDGHTQNDFHPYIYKTTDFGKTWTHIATEDIKMFVRNIQEDYVNPDLLFAGAEDGLYISINGGKQWTKFENNMPSVAVHYIELHKKTNDLILGTHGRGIIILDDISMLRELNQELFNKEVHFFKTKPFVMKESSGFSTDAGDETQFKGNNPSSAARIIYYLKKRHTFGKMTLEIKDMDNVKIVDLEPGKAKGINIVTWNFQSKTPKVAVGKTISYGALTSPRVSAGTYKVVMTKGSQITEFPIEVKYADNGISIEDRKEQEKITRLLFNRTQELAFLVDKIDNDLAFLNKVKDNGVKDKKIKEALQNLTNLKETLVITKGDNYVNSAEPQLREKIADLYSKIAGTYEKPTKAEMLNLQSLEDRFAKAQDSYHKLYESSISKLIQKYQSSALMPVQKTFEEFLEEK